MTTFFDEGFGTGFKPLKRKSQRVTEMYQCETPAPVIFAGTPSTVDTSSRSLGRPRFEKPQVEGFDASHPIVPGIDYGAGDSETRWDSNLAYAQDFEAALRHSRANQALLQEALIELHEEVKRKSDQLNEKQQLIETIEREHRKIKANFRELLDASIEASKHELSRTSSKIVETDPNAASDPNHPLTDDPSISSDGAREANKDFVESSIDALGIKNATLACNMCGNEYLPQQIRELLLTIAKTSDFAQETLRRNTILEKRFDELEIDRDGRIRELHEEIQHVRRQRAEAEAKAAALAEDLGSLKQELQSLHEELAQTHELLSEFKTKKSQAEESEKRLKILEDAYNQVELEKACLQEELATQRHQLLFEIDKHQQLLTTVESAGVSNAAILERVASFESSLTKERSKLMENLASTKKQVASLQQTNLILTRERDSYALLLEESKEQAERLEREKNEFCDKVHKLSEELSHNKIQMASLEAEVTSLTSLRDFLSQEQARNEVLTEELEEKKQIIQASNEKFSQLLERQSGMQKILESKYGRQEECLNDATKEINRLTEQLSLLRSKWESSVKEAESLRAELANSRNAHDLALQKQSADHALQLQQLQEEHNQLCLKMSAQADAQAREIKDKYEAELSKALQNRDESLDRLVDHYESKIRELLDANNAKLDDVIAAKDLEHSNTKKYFEEVLAEVQTKYETQIKDECDSLRRNMKDLSDSYQLEMKTLLERKGQELAEKQQTIDELTAEIDRIKSEHFQHTLSLQHEIDVLRVQQDGEGRRSSILSTIADHVDNESKLSHDPQNINSSMSHTTQALITTYQDQIHELERKLFVYECKCHDLMKDKDTLNELLKEKSEGIHSLQEMYNERMQKMEVEKEQMVKVRVEELLQASKCELLDDNASPPDQKGLGLNGETSQISLLNEKLSEAEASITKLTEDLKTQRKLFEIQIQENQQELMYLNASCAHMNDVLNRNTDLEKRVSEADAKIEDLLRAQAEVEQKYLAERAQLKRDVEYLKNTNVCLEEDKSALQTRISTLYQTIAIYDKKVKEFSTVESKVAELVGETAQLREQLSNAESPSPYNIASLDKGDLSEILSELNAELSALRNETGSLRDEVEQYKPCLAESIKLRDEVSKLRQESHEHIIRIDALTNELANKESQIKDLMKQGSEMQMANLSSGAQGDSSEAQRLGNVADRIDELTRNCAELLELKNGYEHERRVLLHRMEVEKQILSQCLEQKNRQLTQLVETNYRAESLLARNSHLEHALIELTAELEKLRRSNQAVQESPQGHKTSSVDTSEVAQGSDIDPLKDLLSKSQAQVESLTQQLYAQQANHLLEMEELEKRVYQSATDFNMEKSSEEESLLQSLVEKTAQLQSEVARLRRESEIANRIRLSAAGGRFSDIGHPDSQNRDAFLRPGDSNTTQEALERRVNALLEERQMLYQQFDKLPSIVESVEANVTHMDRMKKRDAMLRSAARHLLEILKINKKHLSEIHQHSQLGLANWENIDDHVFELEKVARKDYLEPMQKSNEAVMLSLGSFLKGMAEKISQPSQSDIPVADYESATGAMLPSLSQRLTNLWAILKGTHDDTSRKHASPTSSQYLTTPDLKRVSSSSTPTTAQSSNVAMAADIAD